MTSARSRWLRVGGCLELEGSTTTWCMAEGRLGRRWRTVSLDRSGAMRAMLLEVGPDGRPTRLELATPRGLLTMHPDGQPPRLHGNVVSEAGVRPITLPWSPDHLIAVDGEPLSLIAAVPGLRQDPGASLERPVHVVNRDLAVLQQVWRVERLDVARWRIEPADTDLGSLRLELDERGLLCAIDGVAADAARWSLEED